MPTWCPCSPRPLRAAPLTAIARNGRGSGKSDAALPFIGLARHVVVAETDAQAQQVARAAFPRWRRILAALWERRGVPLPFSRPADWDALQAAGLGIAGSPQTVSRVPRTQSQQAGSNFGLCQMVFGYMDREVAQRSLTLFA